MLMGDRYVTFYDSDQQALIPECKNLAGRAICY